MTRSGPAILVPILIACSETPARMPPGGGGGGGQDRDAGVADSGESPDAGQLATPWALGATLEEGVAPVRRGDMGFAVDPETNRVLFFSGDRAEPAMCNPGPSDFIDDLWVYDGVTERWAPVTVPEASPKPVRRARSHGVWDAVHKRFIVFGGRFRNGTAGPYTFLKDVWALDPRTGVWSELSDQTNVDGPTGRMNTSVVADPDRDRIIIHAGGRLSPDGTSFIVDSETWIFDLSDNSWLRIAVTGTQPPGRIFHMAALDPSRKRMFVFGGGGEDAFVGSFFRDVWYLDLDAETWTRVAADGTFPAARIKGTLELDAPRDRLVLFAGHDDGQLGNDNDVWTFDLAGLTWTRGIEGDVWNAPPLGRCDFPADFAIVDPASPERRESHVFAIAGDRAFMYGGRTDCGLANDTWVLNLVDLTWRQVTYSLNGMTCYRSGRTDCDQPEARKCG